MNADQIGRKSVRLAADFLVTSVYEDDPYNMDHILYTYETVS